MGFSRLRQLLQQSKRAYRRVSPYLPRPLQVKGVHRNREFAFLSNPVFDIGTADIERTNAIQRQPHRTAIKSAIWLIPHVEHIAFGGIYTIFRFMNDFAIKGVVPTVVICDKPDVDPVAYKAIVVKLFPALTTLNVIVWDQKIESIDQLEPADIAVCTYWTTAYLLLRINKVNRKYYFIQDYEPMFYAASSTYALAESTYRFGFLGIVNTPGLFDAVSIRHGLQGIAFVPAVDPRFYFPPAASEAVRGRVRIFFYCRPKNPRNAFELSVLVMKRLLDRFGDRIEIVAAGSDWDESQYGLKNRITNLNLLDGLPAVGSLYRSCQIGVVYMLSKHPSYQPFEFMASGMATVSNMNEDNLWFLRDHENCLLAEPSPLAMAENIALLVEDESLRRRIVNGGYRAVNLEWDAQTEGVWNYISSADGTPMNSTNTWPMSRRNASDPMQATV